MKTLSSETKPERRIPLSMDVGFRKTYGRKDLEANLINISLSGAFLKTKTNDLDLREKINLSFKVGSRTRSLTAKVVWKNAFGAGIQFYHTNNRDVQIIDDLMYFIEESREDRKSVLNQIFDQVA